MNIWALENNTGKEIKGQIELDEDYIIDIRQLSIESDIKEECYERSDTGIKMLIPKEGTKIKHWVEIIS